MADNKAAAVSSAGTGAARDSVCIHTRKIYSSCRDKDCIEDLHFYPTAEAQSILAGAQSLRGGRAELLHTFVDVEPVNFNRGYYTVDLRFYYRIVLQAMTGGARYTEVEGLAVFDKRVMLFGSEGNAKIYSSRTVFEGEDAPLDLGANLPIAVVEAVDPLLLCARFVEAGCNCSCDGGITGVPQGILDAFDSPLVFDNAAQRCVLVSLGQFSIVRLERDTQLRIPVYDYCVPTDECVAVGGCSTTDGDPCEMFDGVEFPIGEFFPPNSIAGEGSSGSGSGSSCSCGCQ